MHLKEIELDYNNTQPGQDYILAGGTVDLYYFKRFENGFRYNRIDYGLGRIEANPNLIQDILKLEVITAYSEEEFQELVDTDIKLYHIVRQKFYLDI